MGLISASESEKNFEDLIEKVSQDECCAFVGAGPSIYAGYPSWTNLIAKLELAAKPLPSYVPCDPKLTPWQKGDWFRNVLGEDNYFSELMKLLDPSSKEDYRPVHEVIMSLPFHGFITTNYDMCLENSVKIIHKQVETRWWPELDTSWLRNGDVFHIHGVYDNSIPATIRSLILTENDYHRAYEESNSLQVFLENLFQFHTVVFMGFSFEDDFFVKAVENSRINLRQRTEFESINGIGIRKEVQRFILIHEDDDSLRLDRMKALEIRPIIYSGDKDRHHGLQELLQKIQLRTTGFTTSRPKASTDWLKVS